MFDEELDAPKKRTGFTAGSTSLDAMSVSELEDYIKELKAEITRVGTALATKKSHRESIEAVFGKK